MFIKPAPGLSVRDPILMDILPTEGREVGHSPYWLRRVRDKDVIAVEQPETQAQPTKKGGDK